MTKPNFHFMRSEVIADQQLVRFSCPICDRCVESGPEGLRIIHRGDVSVRHQGGSIEIGTEIEAEQSPPQTVH